jgi:hypothetical protein
MDGFEAGDARDLRNGSLNLDGGVHRVCHPDQAVRGPKSDNDLGRDIMKAHHARTPTVWQGLATFRARGSH